MKESIKIKYNKYYKLAKIYEMWLCLREEKKSISDYLKMNNIKSIAIYGCGRIGEHLVFDLQNSQVEVKYFIDRVAQPEFYYGDYKVFSPECELKQVDMVIVTNVTGEGECVQALEQKMKSKIVLINELLFDCLQQVTINGNDI